MIENPVLQVALDFENLSDAIKTAKLLKKELHGLDYYCEAGTPLIKNEGLKNVIPSLRKIVGEKTKIVADLKTSDVGALEVEMAKKAGADIVVISGASETQTIEKALKKASELTVYVMIDCISVKDMPGRLDWIINKISDYNKIFGSYAILEYHIPIDSQSGTRDFSEVETICKESNIPVAVAGGLDEKTIPEVIKYGAKICVVGGAITRPKNKTPEKALKEIRKAVYGI